MTDPEHHHTHKIPAGEEPDWLDRWENVKKLLIGFWISCGLLFLFDVFALAGVYDKHAHFGVENVIGFYGIYGFVACVVLVLVAKQLRKVVMRPEGYYEDVADARERDNA